MGCTPASMVYVPGWDKHSVYVGGFWRFSSLWCLDNSSVFKTIWKRANVCIYILHVYIYQDPPMIHLFVYRFYFARAVDFRAFAKNCSFAEKCSRGLIPSPLSVGFGTVFEFAAFCTFFADICGFFAQIFARTSVASKQTIPVFSRAREAKRK